MFAGNSYYHQQQALGRAFVPGELKGYFNDMTGKTQWIGQCDSEGLPVSRLSNGTTIHFPILLCQKALGHWDLWLLERRDRDREEFLKIACWLRDTQDSAGGWDTWTALGQPRKYAYSAMTQGEAISTLVRAHRLTNDPSFATASEHAMVGMRRSLQDGGVCIYEADHVILEEYPGTRRDTVLNGWLFAFFGVRDYLLQLPNADVESFYRRTLRSLIEMLGDFDAGYWSYYSSGSQRLASPFYHRLHLSQLEALRQVEDSSVIQSTYDRWAAYDRNSFYRAWAVFVKGYQKLREPDEITIIG